MSLNYTDYTWLQSWFLVINSKLDLILKALNQDFTHMTQAIDNLQAQLTAMEDAEQSAITLLQTLSQELAANASDPVAIQNIANKLQADAAKLAAAVVANSPTTTTTEAPATTTQDPNQTTTTPPAGA